MDLSLLNQCLPDNWKVTDTSPVPEAIPQEQPPKSTFTSILDAIEKVINFICAFKNKIMGLLGMKMRRYVRRLRYRMLAETRVTRFQKNIFKKIKSRVQKVGAKIKTAAHKVGGKIKEVGNKIKHKFHEIGDKIKKMALSVAQWAKKKWEQFKDWAFAIVNKIKTIWKSTIASFKNFFSGDILGKIKNIFNCAMNLKGVVIGLVVVIKSFIGKIGEITSIAAGNLVSLAKLIMNLICNFSLFRRAVGYLIDSIHEKETIKKFNLVGKFIGLGLRALIVR